MIVFGGALYRFNVYLIGFNPGKGWRYFPSFAEVMVTVGIVALEILAYKVFVALFPVLPNAGGHAAKHGKVKAAHPAQDYNPTLAPAQLKVATVKIQN